MSNTRLRNEPLEKASGGTSYADERDDEECARESRFFAVVCPSTAKKTLRICLRKQLIIWIQLIT
jgi:hypothetical protein